MTHGELSMADVRAWLDEHEIESPSMRRDYLFLVMGLEAERRRLA